MKREIFIPDLEKIVDDLHGVKTYYSDANGLHLILEFNYDGTIINDYLKLRNTNQEPGYGVMVCSDITHKQFVSLYEYTYYLFNWIQKKQHGISLLLKPFTAAMYFVGKNIVEEVQNKN
ncbi:MAG: hypothetical protein J0I09_14395 [Sphingobacteriia bacterium]|nr:hypothetical protein [Sphingobacteriia bacterium]